MKEPINLDDLPIEVLFKYLLRDYKAAKVEIGMLQSEIAELNHQFKETEKPEVVQVILKGIPKSERKEYMMAYYEKTGHTPHIKREMITLINKYNDLMSKYIKVSNELQSLKENMENELIKSELIKKILYLYGRYIAMRIFFYTLEHELYEDSHIIKMTLKECDIDIGESFSREDWINEIRRFGYSGESAYSNEEEYYEQAKIMMGYGE